MTSPSSPVWQSWLGAKLWISSVNVLVFTSRKFELSLTTAKGEETLSFELKLSGLTRDIFGLSSFSLCALSSDFAGIWLWSSRLRLSIFTLDILFFPSLVLLLSSVCSFLHEGLPGLLDFPCVRWDFFTCWIPFTVAALLELSWAPNFPFSTPWLSFLEP